MYWDAFHRRLVSRRRLIAGGGAAALGAGAASLVGCGDGEEKSSTTPGAGTAAAGQPRRGGHIQSSTSSTSISLDLVTSGSYVTVGVMGGVYSRLWKLKTGAGLGGFDWVPLEPDLALSVEQPDKTTYIYKLRPGVKWQDKPPLNGRAFNADDVVYSVRRALDEPKSTIKGNFAMISAVRVVDQQTVQLQTDAPYAPFNAKLGGTITIWITPREIEQNLKDTAIGTGPFLLDSRTPGVGLEYSRNPNYYGSPQPNVDKLTITDIADPSALEAAFTTGKIDTYSVGDRRSFDRVSRAVPDLQSQAYDTVGHHFFFRCDRPPFQDARVRQAYALTIDYEGLIRAFTNGEGQVVAMVPHAMKQWAIPASQWGDGAKYRSKPDLAEAKKLLQAAGYGQGVEYDFYYTSAFANLHQTPSFIQAMAADAEKAGFRARFQVEEYPVYAQRISGKSDYSGMLHLPLGTNMDPDDYVYQELYPGAFRYAGYHKDPELEALIIKQRQEFDTEARKRIITDIERRNLVQNYMLTTIGFKEYAMWQKRLQNYSPRPDSAPMWAVTAWLNG